MTSDERRAWARGFIQKYERTKTRNEFVSASEGYMKTQFKDDKDRTALLWSIIDELDDKGQQL